MANIGSLPVGIFLDRFGPVKLFLLGCALFGSGFLLFGLSLIFRIFLIYFIIPKISMDLFLDLRLEVRYIKIF